MLVLITDLLITEYCKKQMRDLDQFTTTLKKFVQRSAAAPEHLKVFI